MGKILVEGGSKNVPVGKVIALLAEEGDDLNNLEAPEEGGASKSTAEKPEKSAPKAEEPKEEKAEAPKAAEAEKSEPVEEAAVHSEVHPTINIFPAAERL